MEELFRLIRDENDIDKALSLIRSGYMLEPSYKDEYNSGLLFYAVCRKSPVLVKTLVEKGFDVNDRLPGGATPLMYAVRNNAIGIAEYLLENGADLSVGGKHILDIVKDKTIKLYLSDFCLLYTSPSPRDS